MLVGASKNIMHQVVLLDAVELTVEGWVSQRNLREGG